MSEVKRGVPEQQQSNQKLWKTKHWKGDRGTVQNSRLDANKVLGDAQRLQRHIRWLREGKPQGERQGREQALSVHEARGFEETSIKPSSESILCAGTEVEQPPSHLLASHTAQNLGATPDRIHYTEALADGQQVLPTGEMCRPLVAILAVAAIGSGTICAYRLVKNRQLAGADGPACRECDRDETAAATAAAVYTNTSESDRASTSKGYAVSSKASASSI